MTTVHLSRFQVKINAPWPGSSVAYCIITLYIYIGYIENETLHRTRLRNSETVLFLSVVGRFRIGHFSIDVDLSIVNFLKTIAVSPLVYYLTTRRLYLQSVKVDLYIDFKYNIKTGIRKTIRSHGKVHTHAETQPHSHTHGRHTHTHTHTHTPTRAHTTYIIEYLLAITCCSFLAYQMYYYLL